MTQLEFIFSIETKRDLAVTARNRLLCMVQMYGDNSIIQDRLAHLGGLIAAYDEILSEIRSSLIAETLKEWRNNA